MGAAEEDGEDIGHTFEFVSLKATMTVWIYSNVKNAGEIKQRVQGRSFEPECAFIKSSLVPDVFVLQIAAFQALNSRRANRLKTKSLHAELVYNLAGTKQIAEALRTYGMSDDDTSMVVVRFDATKAEKLEIMRQVEGNIEPVTFLSNHIDKDNFYKLHRFSNEEKQLEDLSGGLATRMAARDC